MYKFKNEKKKEIVSKYKLTYMAETIGITLSYLSKVINGKLLCSKMTSYCITKVADPEKEIDYYFQECVEIQKK